MAPFSYIRHLRIFLYNLFSMNASRGRGDLCDKPRKVVNSRTMWQRGLPFQTRRTCFCQQQDTSILGGLLQELRYLYLRTQLQRLIRQALKKHKQLRSFALCGGDSGPIYNTPIRNARGISMYATNCRHRAQI